MESIRPTTKGAEFLENLSPTNSPTGWGSSDELSDSMTSNVTPATPSLETPPPLISPLLAKSALKLPEICKASLDIATRTDIDPVQAHFAGLELLGRRLAYQRSAKFSEITPENPVYLNVSSKAVPYHFDQMIEFGNSPIAGSLRAFSLVSSSGSEPPIILFHGSKKYPIFDEDMANTWLSNFDPRGIGRSALNFRGTKLEKRLSQFFDQTTHHGSNPAIVVGHSLGGTLANLAAIYEPNSVQKAVAFNAPAIHRWAFEHIQANDKSTNPPAMYRFEPASHGEIIDPVTQLGARKHGSTILIESSQELSSSQAHVLPLLFDLHPKFSTQRDSTTTFSEQLAAAQEHGFKTTNAFNEDRPYIAGIIPANKSLFAQTVGSLIAYPALVAIVGPIRAAQKYLDTRFHLSS